MPRASESASYALAPFAFLDGARRRYGDVFTIRRWATW